ncbi:MAG: HDOD domain-containing protein [Treponema sp.]|jgi:putative nucleotidyltransferase with HDIG domain|nr:HDOD domain-containing protein [Treponema sp.]
MDAVPQPAIDEARVKKAIQSGIPLTVTTFTMPREMELYIEQLVTAFLKELDQEKLKDYVVYCVQELAVNAKKANTKRVYFGEQGLNLANPDDYKTGMEHFKEQTLNNLAHYLQLQKEEGLYIKVILHIKQNIIYIEVHNNTVMTQTELARIQDKLANSRQYNNMAEALSQVIDDSEGAGLGLVILILMLKKMGLSENCFHILNTEKETVARISIPLDRTRVENMSMLSETIVYHINSLPLFPENVVQMQKLVADPKSDMAVIARHISMDPALTADLLRIVNSAQYMLEKKVDSISEAVNLIGIRGIRNLLYSYGTQKIFGEETSEKKQLWDHSYKVAFYAYNLAKNFKRSKDLPDDVYVSGILHDMGKIVLSTLRPALLNNIRNFCVEKNIPVSVFESLAAGMNHAEIGARIAEKWNFPEALTVAIRYHHDPGAAPDAYKDLVNAVYLANMFCEYESGGIAFDQIEEAPLESYGIDSRDRLDSLLEQFSLGLNQRNSGS